MPRYRPLTLRFACVATLLVLSACGYGLTPAQQTLKASCVAQDFNACADLGHEVAASRQ